VVIAEALKELKALAVDMVVPDMETMEHHAQIFLWKPYA